MQEVSCGSLPQQSVDATFFAVPSGCATTLFPNSVTNACCSEGCGVPTAVQNHQNPNNKFYIYNLRNIYGQVQPVGGNGYVGPTPVPCTSP